jgi:hypothetical protein
MDEQQTLSQLTTRPGWPDGDAARLDEALAEADWPMVQRLWRLGLANDHIYALLRLRAAVRRRGNPALDGLADDRRLRFARWLVAHGRLTDDA